MNRHLRRRTLCWGICWLALMLTTIQLPGCRLNPKTELPPQETMSRREINAVLSDHDDTLMAIPGVIGVYVGLMKDEKTPCLKVMVVRKTRALERKIPKRLEGYPVVVEETGVIRPL